MKTLATLFLALLLASPGHAADRQVTHAAALDSGALSNPAEQADKRLIGVLTVPGATRLRVPLAVAALGVGSQVRFTSVSDGQSQTLDATHLSTWSNTSAYLNGDSVRLEVIVAPGDASVTVRVTEVFSYTHEANPRADVIDCCGGQPSRTLCGPDNRVASTDNRAGRLTGGCTGWLISNGGVLTAGHCPIGAGSIFEVNIPASMPNGANVASAVQDQFPIVGSSIVFTDGGAGNDWQVFTLGPNNLNQSAHVLHGFFRMINAAPGGGTVVRVTGCGLDNTPVGTEPSVCGNFDKMGNCTHFGLNAQNQTLQTATGGFVSIGGAKLNYSVDTEPANSGSPIIWEANGFTIGIHTHGGCTATGGSNAGTSFGLAALENAIAAVPGPNTRYLDTLKNPSGAEDGTIYRPHDTLGEAIAAVPVGGRISIVRGNYIVAGTTITKAMTLTAPVGEVTLGN